MTRKDWWLGILVIVLALLVHALVVVRANHQSRSAKFWPLNVTETARAGTIFEK
jgi:hypothetical protein